MKWQPGHCLLFGILNLTPDSFSDGGAYAGSDIATKHARTMMDMGADIIDIGGESTRPGAADISPEMEWERIKDVVHTLLEENIPLSLDTRHVETAQAFLYAGGGILNLVDGGKHGDFPHLVQKCSSKVILNHFPGRSITEVHEQKIDSIAQVEDELLALRERYISEGVVPEAIMLDPGIGFGKTMELNTALLDFPARVPGIAVMIGHSRKRFLGEGRFDIAVNQSAARRAIDAGAAALRVHDVSPHREILPRTM